MVGSNHLLKHTDTVDKIFSMHSLREVGACLSQRLSILRSKLSWRTSHIENCVQIRVHSKLTLKSGGAGDVQRSHLYLLPIRLHVMVDMLIRAVYQSV